MNNLNPFNSCLKHDKVQNARVLSEANVLQVSSTHERGKIDPTATPQQTPATGFL